MKHQLSLHTWYFKLNSLYALVFLWSIVDNQKILTIVLTFAMRQHSVPCAFSFEVAWDVWNETAFSSSHFSFKVAWDNGFQVQFLVSQTRTSFFFLSFVYHVYSFLKGSKAIFWILAGYEISAVAGGNFSSHAKAAFKVCSAAEGSSMGSLWHLLLGIWNCLEGLRSAGLAH